MKKILSLMLVMIITLTACSGGQSEEEVLARDIVDSFSNLEAMRYSMNQSGVEIVLDVNSNGDYVMDFGDGMTATYLEGTIVYCLGEDLGCYEDAAGEDMDFHSLLGFEVNLVSLGDLESQEDNVLTFSSGDVITVDLENQTIEFDGLTMEVIDDFDVELPEDYTSL